MLIKKEISIVLIIDMVILEIYLFESKQYQMDTNIVTWDIILMENIRTCGESFEVIVVDQTKQHEDTTISFLNSSCSSFMHASSCVIS